jgi:hypothetical protein
MVSGAFHPLENPTKIFSGFLPSDLQKPVRGMIH